MSLPHGNGHISGTNGWRRPHQSQLKQDEEIVRLMIQALGDMGYTSAVQTLSKESGVQVESALVAHFRQAILDGDWIKGEDALKQLELNNATDLGDVLFLIREQKFLELLEGNRTSAALSTLRTELLPIRSNVEQLHFLSSLVMTSSPADLQLRAKWSGAQGDSRAVLLRKISTYISPNSMIPEARLRTLLGSARQVQIENCLYHTSTEPISLLIPNHRCPRTVFPLHSAYVLRDHSDEVWHVQYAPSGQYLATTGADGLIVVYDSASMRSIHFLNRRTPDELKRDNEDGRPRGVSYIVFNHDETMLMTCSQDNVITHWDIATGQILNQISHTHDESISSVAWLPHPSNGGFASGGLDKKINLYDDKGDVSLTWHTGRIYDLKVSNNGKYLVAIGTDSGLYIFDLTTHQRIALLQLDFELTSIAISGDSSRILVSCSPSIPKGRSVVPKSQAMEIQEWSIPDLRLLRKVHGQKQGKFVIRSCYAGHAEQFIMSGSEDSDVYLWHRASGTLLERISGHTKSVGSVHWNPATTEWASASDDKTVRVWRVEAQVESGSPVQHEQGAGDS